MTWKMRVQRDLEEILANNECPPPSMREVERRLGYSKGYLHHRFPEMCCEIVKRYQVFLQTQVKQRKTSKTYKSANEESMERQHNEPMKNSANDDQIRLAFEEIIKSSEGLLLSLSEVARTLGHTPSYLRNVFPDLCEAISAQRREFYAAKKLQLKRELEAALTCDQVPPPSVNEIARRFECNGATLWHYWPQLCQGIAERHYVYCEGKKAELKEQLEIIISREEFPPPSINAVAERLGSQIRTLRNQFPDQVTTICDRYQAYKENAELKLRQALEMVLASNEYPPPSLSEVARRFRCHAKRLRELFPEECSEISRRYLTHRQATHEQLRQTLEAVLLSDEDPPPSLEEIARRLGRVAPDLRVQFPELSAAISKRYQANRELRKLDLQRALEDFLTNAEPPLPLAEVARQLNYLVEELYNLFPDLCQSIVKRNQVYQEVKKQQLRETLEVILAQEEDPPPSLGAVAKQLGYNIKVLTQLFPDHTCRIVSKHSAYVQERKKQREQQLYNQIREVTFQIYQEGLYPTTYQVSLRLPKPGVMLDPKVRAAWREALQELGLVERDDEEESG